MRIFHFLSKKPGISIVTACMNRNKFLDRALKTWVKTNVDEIVIVNWGTDPSIVDLVKKHACHFNGNFKVINVPNRTKWVLTKAYNFGVMYTKHEKILKLDCDVLLNERFFELNPLIKGTFVSGDWKLARNRNEMHLNGNVYFYKSDFYEVNGYNEYLETYGYDDCDLYARLSKTGLIKKCFNFDTLLHIEHSNELRVKNQSISRLDVEVEKNRLLCERLPWNGPMSYLNVLDIERIDSSIKLYSVLVSKETLPIDPVIERECLEKAVQNILWKEKQRNKDKFRLYIKVNNGLGNRLRALASAYVIAKESNRDLVVIWIPDFHCECHFSDIFKTDELLKDSSITIESHFNILAYIKEIYVLHEDLNYYDYSNEKNKYINDEVKDDLYIESACRLNNSKTSWAKENNFLKSLMPVNKIFEEFIEYSVIFDIQNCIGVHIRMGQDEEVYEQTVNWNDESRAGLSKWRALSDYKIFARKMHEILEENSSQRFFVCCDRKSTYEKLHAEFGEDAICSTKKIYFDRCSEQLQNALLDLILLSKTKYILGSNWSSFTEIAYRLNTGRKLLLAGKDFF